MQFLFLFLTYVEVGCRPHLPVFGNDIYNQRVAHQSNQHDEGEEEGDQPGVCEEGVLIIFLLLIFPVSSQREVCLGAVDPYLLGGVPELLRGVHCDRTGRIIVREVKEKARRRAGRGEVAIRRENECVVSH